MSSESKHRKIRPIHMWRRRGQELKRKNKCRGLSFFNSALRKELKRQVEKLIKEQ